MCGIMGQSDLIFYMLMKENYKNVLIKYYYPFLKSIFYGPDVSLTPPVAISISQVPKFSREGWAGLISS